MPHDRLSELVRRRVVSTFQQLGKTSDRPPQESILIRNGHYCGRRFDADGLQAVWFAEEAQLKFFDREGALFDVCDVDTLGAADSPEQVAAETAAQVVGPSQPASQSRRAA